MKKLFVLLLSFLMWPSYGQTSDPSISPTRKGQVFISTTFSVDHSESVNEQTLLINYDDSYFLNWQVTLRSGYFIKDDFAVGGLVTIESDLKDFKYQQDGNNIHQQSKYVSVGLAPFIRNYLPLGNGTFALFNETFLEFSFGSGVRQTEDINDINRTVSEAFGLKLGLRPGITAFITETTSFEIGTSLLGLSTRYETGVTNGDEDNQSTKFSNNVNFEIDLFSLFLGVSFYFPS